MNASRCQVARTVLLSRPQDRRLFQTTSQVGAFGPDRTLDDLGVPVRRHDRVAAMG